MENWKKNRRNKINSNTALNHLIHTDIKAILFLLGFDSRSHSNDNVAFFVFKYFPNKNGASGRGAWFKTAQ